MVHIICDTTAGLSAEYVEAHPNVHVIPLYIDWNGEYVDERCLSIYDIFEYVEKTKKVPLTSQPSIGEVQKIVDTIPAEDGIIIITITGAVSGTPRTMAQFAKQNERQNIVALDSHTTEAGMQFLVEDAVAMNERGESLESIAASLSRSIQNTRTMFVPSTLEYLKLGGRIGKIASLLGALLQIRPVVYVNEVNELDVLDKVRTSKKGHLRMLEEAFTRPIRKIAIPHIAAEKEALALKERILAQAPDLDIRITTGTPALATHLGPGLVSLMVEWVDEEGRNE